MKLVVTQNESLSNIVQFWINKVWMEEWYLITTWNVILGSVSPGVFIHNILEMHI